MKMHLRLGIVVTGLLLTAGPVLAQKPEPGGGPGGDRGGAASGGGVGSTVSSSGGGGGNIVSGGGGSVSSDSSGGGVSASSPSAAGFSSPSVSGGGFRTAAPEHRIAYSAQSSSQATPRGTAQSGDRTPPPSGGGNARSGGAASGGDRAVARGERGENRAPASTGSARRAAEGTPNNASGASEVPNWSRPRGDRPSTDTAVTRVGPRPGNGGGNDHCRDCYGYYDPYYYGGFGYGLGYYDSYYGFYGYPFYAPLGFGYGIPSGYFDPFYADPYGYGGGYGAYSNRVYGGHDQGSLKLKVKPRNAKVYVDGYYVGLVDEFDGAFQKLTLNGGRHKVELRAEGYETSEFDVLITPEQTITFAGDMKKTQ